MMLMGNFIQHDLSLHFPKCMCLYEEESILGHLIGFMFCLEHRLL